MKKLFSVLTDDLDHCIITGDSNRGCKIKCVS